MEQGQCRHHAQPQAGQGGGEPFVATPEALGKFQLDEAKQWGKDIKAAGIERE